jgi:hypothetical protein
MRLLTILIVWLCGISTGLGFAYQITHSIGAPCRAAAGAKA